MNNKLVGKVEDYKYLGVTISNDLRWSKHCQKISSKAPLTLGIIRRSLHSAPKDVKDQAYQALVRPQLEYTPTSWNPYTAKDLLVFRRFRMLQQGLFVQIMAGVAVSLPCRNLSVGLH